MKILKIKNIGLIIICFCLANIIAKGQAEINDTTISLDVVSLPVIGWTENWIGKPITYIFKVNWVSFELLEITGNVNSAILNNNIQYNFDWETGEIIVKINEIKPNFNKGVLFNIVVRILTNVYFYDPYDIFTITPKSISIGDSLINLEEKTAQISLNYTPTNLTYISDISFNYPNPFNYETKIMFSLNETQSVNCEIYNSLGVCVKRIPDKNEDYSSAFYYELINSNRQDIKIEESNILEKGLYHLLLRKNFIEIASDVYYLVFRIGDGYRLIKMGIN